MLVARLSLALVTQLFLAGIFLLTKDSHPWQAAASWWMVTGTLVDLGCLVLLIRLTRREGIRLVDLLGIQRSLVGRDLLLGLLYTVALVPAILIGSLLTQIFFGSPAPPQVSIAAGLPLWAALYSILVWPVVWAFTEETTYLGYALPRLEALFGRAWVPALLVVFFWALQHITMPLIFDGRYLLYRALSALPVTATITLLFYFRGRRLLPLMVMHWLSNALTAILAAFLVVR